jgi:hypothetical protein
MNNTTFTIDNPIPLKSARASLRIGGVAAVLASICCLGPFLLITIVSAAAGFYFL